MQPNCASFYKISSVTLVMLLLCIIIVGCQEEESETIGIDKNKIAKLILDARKAKKKIQPVSMTYTSLTVDQAYDIQEIVLTELVKEHGRVAGYKIGYADSGALLKNKIDVPAYGPLFLKQIVKNGGTVPVKDFFRFSIENEITFKVGRDIDKIFKVKDEILPYIESIHIGFDISEGIFSGSVKVQDFIANAAGSKYFLVGEGINPGEIDVKNIMLSVIFNNQTVYTGSSKNVLGDPWNVIFLVSNDLLRRGNPLTKGQLIFSGKAAPAFKSDLDTAVGKYTGTGEPFKEIFVNAK